MAGDLVTYNLTNWGNQTCLSLGVLSRLLGFIAHPCVQCLLSEKWTDTLQFTGSQFKQVRSDKIFFGRMNLIVKIDYISLQYSR